MEEGLLAVRLELLPGSPEGFVDERDGQIFITESVAKELRRQGCDFVDTPIYIGGRWLHMVHNSRHPDYLPAWMQS